MEHFVAKNFLEDLLRRRIIVHELAVDGKPAGCRLFRDVKECKEPVVGLAFDAQVVEAVAAGKRVAVEDRRGARRTDTQHGRAALAKEVAVAELVNRVLQIQTPQQRVRRQLGRAQDVAAAVRLDFGEGQKLPYASIEIAPDPLVYRLEQCV